MKVIVCGGRYYADRERLYLTLDLLHAATPITVLMHGNAKGADHLADDWAMGKVRTATFPPAWEQHGRAGEGAPLPHPSPPRSRKVTRVGEG